MARFCFPRGACKAGVMTPQDFSAFRETMGWTHRQCAACFGVELSTWHTWRAGKARISDRFRPRAAEVLAMARTLRGRARLARWAEAQEREIEALKSGARFRAGG